MKSELLTNTKVASVVAASATGAGVSEWLGWIPDDIGKLTALVGLLMSVVLLISHSWKLYREYKDSKRQELRESLEIEKLKEEIKDLKEDD